MMNHRLDDARVVGALAQAAAHNKNTLPLMADLGGIMHSEVNLNFRSQGRPPWEALSPVTIKQRMREGSWPGKILDRSGAAGLYGNISTDITPTRAAVGTNKPYGRILHEGGVITRDRKSKRKKDLAKGPVVIKIPARPFLVMAEAGIRKMLDAVERFIFGRGGG